MNYRPHLDEFLQRVEDVYEIIIFTASETDYANKLIDQIDKRKKVKHRLFRDSCSLINGVYLKELKKLNRKMKGVIIVDNNPNSFIFDRENGLPIKSYYGDKGDKELLQIAYILDKIEKFDDVRPLLREIVDGNVIDYDRAYQLFRAKGKRNVEKIEIVLKKDENNIISQSNKPTKQKTDKKPLTAQKSTVKQSKNTNLSNNEINLNPYNSFDQIENTNQNNHMDSPSINQINSSRSNQINQKSKIFSLVKCLHLDKLQNFNQSITLDIQNDLSSAKNKNKNKLMNSGKLGNKTKKVNNPNPNTNKDPNKKKDVIKRVIAYMTLGVDVSKLFFEMVKASITDDIVLKKMVFLYIVNYADQVEQGAILAINTFLKDMKNPNPKIRGLALRSLCSLTFKGAYEYFSNSMYDSLKDAHPYVRKTAVLALLKVYNEMCEEEIKKHVIDIDVDTPAGIKAFKPGYISEDDDVIVGLQTDKLGK